MKYNCKLCGFGILIFLFVMVNFTKHGNESWTRPSDCTSSVLDLERQQIECRGLEKGSSVQVQMASIPLPLGGRRCCFSSCFSVHKWNRTKRDLAEETPFILFEDVSPIMLF